MVTSTADSSFRPARIDDIEINPADDGYIIYQAEYDKVIYLNPAAVLILEVCDGNRSVPEIVRLVEEAYGLPETAAGQIEEAIEKLRGEGLLT